MARRSLRPHLNQIRSWVRQGRTDAWIAHQLEVTVQQIEAFKRENDLAPAEENGADASRPISTTRSICAPRTTRRSPQSSRRRGAPRPRRRPPQAAAAEEEAAKAAAERAERARTRTRTRTPRRRHRDEAAARSPRRSRARTPRTAPSTFEGTFDHGEEGYGLWLDPAVPDDPIYAEHWAGHRPVEITIEEDQIVIRRAGSGEDEENE